MARSTVCRIALCTLLSLLAVGEAWAQQVLPRSAWTLRSVSSQELVNENGAALNSIDGNAATYWHTEWYAGSLPQHVEFDLGASYTIQAFRYLPRPYTGKPWETNGRIRDFQFYVSADGVNWGLPAASGTLANTQSEKEVALTSPATGRYVRLVALSEVNGHPRWISMAEFNLIGTPLSGNLPPTAVDDGFTVAANSSGNLLDVLANDLDTNLPADTLSIVSVGTSPRGASISHNGTRVIYTPAIGFSGTDTFTYVVRDAAGATDSGSVTVQVGQAAALLSRAAWTLRSVSSQELVNENGAALNAIDGNAATIWHTEWYTGSLPQHVEFDLGASYRIEAFRHRPRPYTGKPWETNGRIKDFQFYVSADGVNWGLPAASGTLANTQNETEVALTSPATGRYVRLVALSEVNGHPRWISMAEFNLVGTPLSGNLPPTAVDDGFTVAANSSGNLLDVLANDLDANLPADTLSIVSVGTSPRGASISHNGTRVIYTPPSGFAGSDSFTYVVRDIAGATDSGSITVQVSGTAPSVLSRSGWTLRSVSNQELVGQNGAAVNALDGNAATIWHTEWYTGSLPHHFEVDLGSTFTLTAFRYLPRPYTGQFGETNGRIKDFKLYVSEDGVNWGSPAASGALANTQSEKEVALTSPATGRYVRLVALSEVNGHPRWISMAEFNLVGTPGPGGATPPRDNSHYWSLNETSGGVFADTYGGLPGSCTTCPQSVPGRVAAARSFASGTASLAIAASSTMDFGPSTDFSVETWVRAGSCTGTQAFIERNAAGSGKRWMLGCKDGVAIFHLDDGSNPGQPLVLSGFRTIANGQWHHVAGVRDAFSGEARLYVDGQVETRATRQFPVGFAMPGLGTSVGWSGTTGQEQRFRGELDELAVHGRALSRAEIDRHFSDGALGLALGYASCPVSTPVMPLGDSITRRQGYRLTLTPALRSEGYRLDFVGTRTDTCTSSSPCSHDPHQQGSSGWTPAQIAGSLASWLSSKQPRVVLLHAGTNELDLTGMASILDIIQQYDPATVVVLARIINRQVYDPATTAFNNNLTSLALARIAAGQRIRVVDQESALTYPDDMEDLLHPNAVGFAKMKDVWGRDLRRFLPACAPVPPLFTSEPVTQAVAGTPYEYEAVAAGVPRASYALLEGPAGVTVHPATGRVFWPSPAAGSHTIRVQATNASGTTVQSFTLQRN